MVIVFGIQSLSPFCYNMLYITIDMLYFRLKFCKENTYGNVSFSPDADVTPDLFVLPW